MTESLPGDIRQIAAAQVTRLAETVAGLTDGDLIAPTRCTGWLVAHLLAHVRLGLTEQAASFAVPADRGAAPDRDWVNYWKDFPPAEPPGYGTVRFLWATGSAYATADSLRRHFADTARQAAGASRNAPEGLFAFQEHVLWAEDILAMWTVEWVVHQLDLIAFLPGDRPGPADGALVLAARLLDRLTGLSRWPPGWDRAGYVLRGTGRVPLDAGDRAFLGGRAARFPAFG